MKKNKLSNVHLKKGNHLFQKIINSDIFTFQKISLLKKINMNGKIFISLF